MTWVGYGTGGRVGVFYSRSRSMIPNLIPYSLYIIPPNPAHPPNGIFWCRQNLRHVSENRGTCARPLALSVWGLFFYNLNLQYSHENLQIESCTALVFTVVRFHLEATLPQKLNSTNRDRLCFTDQSPLRHSKTHYKVWHCVWSICVSS